MSLRALSWALYDAPVENAEERAILMVLANNVLADGSATCPIAALARVAVVSEADARQRLAALAGRGLITCLRDPDGPAPTWLLYGEGQP